MVDIQEFIDSNAGDEEKVVKELLDVKKNIEAKTELSHEQIVEICKLKHIAKKYKLADLSLFIQDFMLLSVSKDRKGRKEFIEALQHSRETRQGMGGMFRGMGDGLR